MSHIKCPICDAEPGEPCYDPHGDLPYKGKHHGRLEAEIAARLEAKDEQHHQAEITRINREKAIAEARAKRSEHEKAIDNLRD